jgi:hypothetical protein
MTNQSCQRVTSYRFEKSTLTVPPLDSGVHFGPTRHEATGADPFIQLTNAGFDSPN